MNSRERRIDTRINLNVPLRFRVLNIPNSQELTGESINISQRGILFATAVPLVVGTPLEVSLKMPREVEGHAASDLKCIARVVHVEPNAFLGGKAGIGLHIEQYQARADAKAEVGTGVVPRDGGNQLFRNQPLGDIFGSLKGYSRSVLLHNGFRRFDIEEKGTPGLARFEAGVA